MNKHGGENHYLIAANGTIFPLADLGVTVTGIGDIPVDYVTARGHRQHGHTVQDWTLQSRSLAFTFDRFACTRQQFWQRRQELFNILSPVGGAVTYRRVLPDGSRRDIQGWAANLAANPGEDGRHFPVSFSLNCPDPSWYDPSVQTYTIQHSNENLTFPLTFPITFGIDGIGAGTVTNNGNWRTYPTITLTGPFEWAAIANETTGALLNIQAQHQIGETTLIDLTPGQQSITRDGMNAFNSLGDDSNLADWYLAPGENFISVSSREDDDESSVTVAYYDRYIAL